MIVLCDNNHQEIVYESNSYKATCPLCHAKRQISQLEVDVERLEEEKADAGDSTGSQGS